MQMGRIASTVRCGRVTGGGLCRFVMVSYLRWEQTVDSTFSDGVA